ncbi:hypothetical protein BDK51DRAFT_43045 [Blyttiomyces helicus]|uniref:Uncharacterized protein n=1 Tax=Blyttiomyces helicus TaxID=388810 RepID=A0A4P9WDK3_9FUNG|nr:hypothetical protein BDK51DRAFT_43045 [Blyttiomyces helicus]|eukprot:RKO89805.1 hypothetical protein BDK51DRAFT_43045 [Blyttiomyces helicus]
MTDRTLDALCAYRPLALLNATGQSFNHATPFALVRYIRLQGTALRRLSLPNTIHPDHDTLARALVAASPELEMVEFGREAVPWDASIAALIEALPRLKAIWLDHKPLAVGDVRNGAGSRVEGVPWWSSPRAAPIPSLSKICTATDQRPRAILHQQTLTAILFTRAPWASSIARRGPEVAKPQQHLHNQKRKRKWAYGVPGLPIGSMMRDESRRD